MLSELRTHHKYTHYHNLLQCLVLCAVCWLCEQPHGATCGVILGVEYLMA
jgi:hypothetical protein